MMSVASELLGPVKSQCGEGGKTHGEDNGFC